MADPFSIIVGTVSLIDCCWRFGNYIKDVQTGAAQIDDEIVALLREVEAVRIVNEKVKANYMRFSTLSVVVETGPNHLKDFWRDISSNVHECRLIVEQLEALVEGIVGKNRAEGDSRLLRKLDGFRKQLRKESKEAAFFRFKDRLAFFHRNMQLLLLINAQEAQDETGKSLGDIRKELASLQQKLDAPSTQSPQLQAQWSDLASPNQHFFIPDGVEKDYTGRLKLLDEVHRAFTAQSPLTVNSIQRRIVVFGVGGSGKTQFCCKYAQLYRQSVNAETDESLKQTYQEIARIGGVADNFRAAKQWLSNLRYPWLLIIDNADDPDVQLQDYIPEGERGHILITTRSPFRKQLGTAGPQSFHFQGLAGFDATTLLLKAASEPEPWDEPQREQASTIAESLGCLPLAIRHAGKAIVKRLCSLNSYLKYLELEKQKIRKARQVHELRKSDDIYTAVYSSFEINFRGLKERKTTEADDAIQLLQMLSFFHRENIRLEFLRRAALNPMVEKDAELQTKANESAQQPENGRNSPLLSLKRLVMHVAAYITEDRTPPILPDFLKGGQDPDQLDFRLNAASNELSQYSLIIYNDNNDSYSIHPVVHSWVRERRECGIIEPAIWCQAAVTALAQCILLPPLASTEADERFRHELLPHIDHARDRQAEIDAEIASNQKRGKRVVLYGKASLTRRQIGHMARFSRVYAQEGKLEDAAALQVIVKDYLISKLGDNHELTLKVKSALAGTYYQLTRPSQAVELLEQVLNAYTSSMGGMAQPTLNTMVSLGTSQYLQGRYTDASKLFEKAHDGLRVKLGPVHDHTLAAAHQLGLAYAGLWRTDEARRLLRTAVDGMRKSEQLGPWHLDTLTAIHDLAATFVQTERREVLTGAEIEKARQLMEEVLEKRTIKLGKEHPFTLWAIANLARMKSLMGQLQEAEADLRAALAVATRDFGPENYGTLFGKIFLAETLMRGQRYGEAEELLVQTTITHRRISANGEHPDRIRALELLSLCYQRQGQVEVAVLKLHEAVSGLGILGGHLHPYMKLLKESLDELHLQRPTWKHCSAY